MPNPNLFHTKTSQPLATSHNNAGGRAYKTSDMHALAQLACTGVFNNTYYTKAENQLKQARALCKKVSPATVARIAVYSRQQGMMKDMPVLLLTYLFSIEDKKYFNAAFPYVVNNIGQLRSFVQMVRSGVCGRRSLGSAGKRAIANMLNTMTPRRIFWQATGKGMSFADVLKLAHVRPQSAAHDSFFAYMLGKSVSEDFEKLPENIQHFELFKRKEYSEVPDVPFQRLTNLDLSVIQWGEVTRKMTWNQLRFNLNNLTRKGVFKDTQLVLEVATKLRNPKAVLGSKVLPFSLYNTVKHLDDSVPQALKNAMVDALEISGQNAPVLQGNTLVLVDSSGSMNSPTTGYRAGATTTMRCVEAAGYFAVSILKANPDSTTILPFDGRVHPVNLNPRDSMATLIKKLPTAGGSTNIACGIEWALHTSTKFNQIIIVSDNESWVNSDQYMWYSHKITATKQAFERYRRHKSPGCKMICINIQPSTTTTQAPDDKNTLNVGGLSDAVFRVASQFLTSRGNAHWEDVLNKILPNLK